MTTNGEQNDVQSVIAWNPAQSLRLVSDQEAQFSRGFLRCKPSGWFPGFGAYWLPLAHSVGVEMKFVEARPAAIGIPSGLRGYAGYIDEEPLAVVLDREAEEILVDTFIPESADKARGVVLEYMARRLMTSLALCWSGNSGASFRFDSRLDPRSLTGAGSIRATWQIEGKSCVVWFVLGPKLVQQIDGLWRRELHSRNRGGSAEGMLRIEIAQLAVPPSLLPDYMHAGTIIDLQVPMTDSVVLRLGTRPWMTGKLVNIQGKFGVEIQSSSPTMQSLPEGATRLAIELGSMSVEGSLLAECSQPGSILETRIAMTDRVNMVINNEVVGKGILQGYQGGFALTVE